MMIAMVHLTLKERFEAQTMPEPNTGCLLWIGPANRYGRGHIHVNGKYELAPRVAFFLAHGRWPVPCALHRCDTPACVDDAHLFEGTQLQNIADRHAKGRDARGQVLGRFSDAEIEDMRTSTDSIKACARRHGTHHGYVSRIRRGLKRAPH